MGGGIVRQGSGFDAVAARNGTVIVLCVHAFTTYYVRLTAG